MLMLESSFALQISTNVKNLQIHVHKMLLVQTLWGATSVLAILVLQEMVFFAVSVKLKLICPYFL